MSEELLILPAIGLVAGVLGGLLGVGGSVLMIPAMMLLLPNPNQHLYQGAAMIVNFFVILPAVVQHHRAGGILKPVIRVTIPVATLSVLLGVWLSHGPWFLGGNEVYLSRTFGAFLIYAAGYNGYRLFSQRRLPEMDDETARSLPKWKIALAVAFPMGAVGGLLGIGGGAMAVPSQQIFLRIPLRRAIANSAATILTLSVAGAVFKNIANAHVGIPFADSVRLAAWLIPTAIVGGYIGGRLTHLLPRELLRIAVIVLMLYGGLAMLRRPFPVVEPSVEAVLTLLRAG